MGDVTWPR